MWQIVDVYIDADNCDCCGVCTMNTCPTGAIECSEPYYIDSNRCTLCGTCIDVCWNRAIIADQVWVDDEE